MGIITIPATLFYVFGQCFDVQKFNLVPVYPYENVQLDQYVTFTDVNTLTAEYILCSTPREMAEFLKMPDPIFWKEQHKEDYTYAEPALAVPIEYLDLDENDINKSFDNFILIKLDLRTVRKTIPTSTPQAEGWKAKQLTHGGTHYIKSVVFGSYSYTLVAEVKKNRTIAAEVHKAIENEIGRKGTYDEKFIEKLKKLEDTMGMHFLEYQFYSDGLPTPSAKYYLSLLDIMKKLKDGSIVIPEEPMQLDLHSLSELCIPIEISSEIIERGKQLQLMYEDVIYTSEKLKRFKYQYLQTLQKEDRSRLEHFEDKLEELKQALDKPIESIDVSTKGDIHQFDRAFEQYGSNDTRTYQRLFEEFKSELKLD